MTPEVLWPMLLPPGDSLPEKQTKVDKSVIEKKARSLTTFMRNYIKSDLRLSVPFDLLVIWSNIHSFP